MEYTQIKETCLYISDLDTAQHFYGEVLEMPIISRVEKRHIFFRCGSSILLCFIPEATQNENNLPSHYSKGKQHIAFEVPAKAYLKTKVEILKKGIVLTHEQEWKRGLQSFYFEDPFGNVLEIVPIGIWN